MQSWGDFTVGDIVEITNWSPNWDGTIGEIVAIEDTKRPSSTCTIACQLRYLSFATNDLNHPNAKLGEIEEGFGWYLDDGHVRKLESWEPDEFFRERIRFWHKFFEGDK